MYGFQRALVGRKTLLALRQERPAGRRPAAEPLGHVDVELLADLGNPEPLRLQVEVIGDFSFAGPSSAQPGHMTYRSPPTAASTSWG